ncbi:MAG: hypothetical protein QOF51_4142 [Chloroflexota bacterium]|jgi:photosystem II stability/assembly factor-like uncharacterized protein|nr:hypothetical protein [Chloroflexota bacterium]
MTVSVSPNGRNHYETSAPSNEVLVATTNGIVALTRSGPGAPWQESRRMLEGKHVGSVVVEQRSGTIFAGVHKGGLWASADGGQSWERRDDGIADDDVYSVNAVEAGDEVRIYAGTEPAHLYVSTDLGKSWTELPSLRDVPSVNEWTFPAPPHVGHVKTIAFDPRDANTIYVGVEVGGAFKSTDAGKTWRELNGFYEDVHRLMVTSARPDDIYMSTGRAVYHSADAGDTWEEFTLPQARIAYPDALVILPNQPDVMFTAGASASPGAWRESNDANSRIARSRDAGRTWDYLEGGLPEHVRGNVEGMTMNVYPGGFALFAGTTDGDVFFSDDEGEHWATIGQGLPPVSKSGHFRALRPDLAAAR